MEDFKMGVIESRFADIIWDKEPISSSELARCALATLNWKKSTSFTVLKRLCDKGIFQNNGGSVSSLISKSDYYSMQSEKFVEETFSGSLPAFIAAFTSRKKLTTAQVGELRRLLKEYEEE